MTTKQFARFIAKIRFVDRDEDLGECWEWTAGRLMNGYGVFYVPTTPRKTTLAHRCAYEHFIGPIQDGYDTDHLCRNKACVNPRHLEAVSRSTNISRGLSRWTGHARKAVRKYADDSWRHAPKSAEHRAKLAEARRAWWAKKREAAA